MILSEARRRHDSYHGVGFRELSEIFGEEEIFVLSRKAQLEMPHVTAFRDIVTETLRLHDSARQQLGGEELHSAARAAGHPPSTRRDYTAAFAAPSRVSVTVFSAVNAEKQNEAPKATGRIFGGEIQFHGGVSVVYPSVKSEDLGF